MLEANPEMEKIIDEAITESEREFAQSGVLIDLDEAFEMLDMKYYGAKEHD